LKFLKLKWVSKNRQVLERVRLELDQCKNVGIYYLLLTVELNLTRVLKLKKENKRLHHKLMKHFEKIPIACRNSVGKSLKMDGAYNANNNFKAFRTWSETHLNDSVDIALELNAVAIRFSRKKEYQKAAIVYYGVYQNALKYPHPSYITNGLNNAAWYRKFSDLERAVKVSEELGYYLGYYLEYDTALIGYLDTILVIAKENNDYTSFYQSAKLLNFYYEALTKNIPKIREKYKRTMLHMRKSCLVRKKKGVKRNEVTNSKRLQKFLNQQIRKPRTFAKENGIPHSSLYRILNGEKKTVRIKTLIRVIRALGLSVSFDHPREVNVVLLCERESQRLVMNEEKLRRQTSFERKITLLRGLFVQVLDDMIDYSKLFSFAEDTEKFIEYIDSDYHLKQFINTCFEPKHPYYKARNDLFNILLEAVGSEKISELVELYASLQEVTDVELLNIYFREYARYSTTNWNFDVQEILEERFLDCDYKRIVAFCERLNLSQCYGYVCTWVFEDARRERLIGLFSG